MMNVEIAIRGGKERKHQRSKKEPNKDGSRERRRVSRGSCMFAIPILVPPAITTHHLSKTKTKQSA
jgi:hypothetical protein